LRDTFRVVVKFDEKNRVSFESLVHLWSEYYKQYLKADYPVLMIRFEDLIFQPETVLREIADCVGAKVKVPLSYQLKTSKPHGSGTDFMKALIKTADAKARPHNMTVADLDFAREHLDTELMELFQYNVPSLSVGD
jgi:hypothetical protein